MKYLVLSFDDGQREFFDVVYPILAKEKINATLNIITGFTDNSKYHISDVMSVEQVKEVYKNGVEIGNHTDSHLNPTNIDDINTAQKKLISWLSPKQSLGLVLPNNQRINGKILKWSRKNNIAYIRTGSDRSVRIIEKILLKIGLVNEKKLFVTKNCRIKKEMGIPIYHSFEILFKHNSEYYKKIIDFAPNKSVITFVFHTVHNSYDQCLQSTFAEGAWEKSNLLDLIKYAKKNDVQIITQIDSLNI